MKKIKKVAVYVNRKCDKSGKYTAAALDILKSCGAEITMCEKDAALAKSIDGFKFVDTIDELADGSDALIMLGGDGTMLEICGAAARHRVPIFGINLGHLGFLTSVEKTDVGKLSCLFSGDYTTEKRMMIDVETGGSVYTALNEAALFSAETSKIAHFSLFCDGRKAIDIASDGLIVSTPTGSTAYSLSAGGPIIDPSTELFCVSPVCPHALGSRPIVFSADSVLGVSGITSGSSAGITVLVDGKKKIPVAKDDAVKISRSALVTETIKIGEDRFFDILNTKFYKR